MSGRKAKAIRKSAKKTAAEKSASAPASNGARLEEFIIGNVRCFAGEQRVPIRPITLLVGENSTGKTTFLGCYQRFVDMLSIPSVRPPDGEFSRPPFFMGGFSDIARRVKGRTKPREFRMGGVVVRESGVVSPLVFVYSYGEEKGEASASRLAIGFPDGGELTISKGKIVADKERSVIKGVPMVEVMLSGPRFRHALPSFNLWGDDLLNYNAVVNTIGIGGAHPPSPPKEEIVEKIRELGFPPRSRHAHALKGPRMNYDRMRRFVEEKFHAPIASDEPTEGFILNANVIVSLGECVAVAPIRPLPRRSYESVINGNAEERFLAQMSRMSRINSKEWGQLRGRLVEFGVKSEMFSDLKLENHGQAADAPFSLRVNTRGVDANIADVGYGVSQLLPFLGRVVKASLEKERKHFLFQQPEDHLHPRAQAAFASFIADSAKKDGHTFLVETHSDFIVDRVCTHVAKGEIAADNVALLYFEQNKADGTVQIHRIELNRNGEPVAVPKGYRDFFQHETERVLGLRKD